jgi:glucose/arabinose dehydrogenase
MRRFSLVGAAIVLTAMLPFLAAAQTPSPEATVLPDGLLVRGVSDPKVWYLQDGKRRWIETELAFQGQGFRWTDVTVIDDAMLASYPEGAVISQTSSLGLPLEKLLLPDLAPVAPNDIMYATINGRTALKFTGAFWNRGKGAFELNTKQEASNADGDYPAYQRIFRPDGTFTEKYVGTLFWHQIHNHYHFDDFGEYKLEMVKPAPGVSSNPVVVTQKTTFCMRDDDAIAPPAEGPDQPRTYMGCSGHRQGVSVGWADVYRYTLPDQYFDVSGMPAGIYKLTFKVDLHGFFTETRRDDNIASTLIEIDPAARSLKVIASAAPYVTSANHFPDGMLIRGEGDSRVYVIHADKKRHLKDEAVFKSYGYSWDQVYTLPKGAVDAIPNERLVRMKGAPQIFLLNDAGWRRKLLDPSVMASYGWTNASVAEVSETEFAGYPETDIIVRSGEAYSLNRKVYLGTHDSLRAKGYDMSSVHLVNDTDFHAYATGIAARDLAVPWDIVFLPDGDMLTSERPGTLRRLGKTPAAIDIPEVLHSGEGGLMGLALHPDFAANHLVYIYYTTDEGGQHNRVGRYRLEGDHLTADKIVLDGIPSAIYHDGGQIAFGPDGMLYVTTGDANSPDSAQDRDSLAGKILRITPDGGIPSDNPFGTAVWSYGHRNPQGIAWDDKGRMWETEHGRTVPLSGYDELNLIEKGKNYGWPVIQGDAIAEGMTRPVHHSGADVTWAPSGLAFSDGKLWFAGLKGEALYEVSVDDQGKLLQFLPHFKGVYGRLRAVVVGPDKALYVTTSNRDGRGTVRAGDDKIIRIHPDFLWGL